MRTWILALVLVALPVSALDVILDGDNVGTLQKITVTQDKVNVSTVSTDQGNEPAKPAPEPELEPTPEPEPEPEPEPGTTCRSSGVTCNYHISSWPSEGGRTITIPASGTVASRFTATAAGGNTGKLAFDQSKTSGMPAINVWFSESPGGPALPDYQCSAEKQTYIFSLAWGELDYYKVCSLEPGATYYINMQHSSPQGSSSIVYRYIK